MNQGEFNQTYDVYLSIKLYLYLSLIFMNIND